MFYIFQFLAHIFVGAEQFVVNFSVDDLEKGDSDIDSHSLNAENLQKFNSQKSGLPTKESLLSDDKMKSIMSFLDEVQVSERLSTVDQVIAGSVLEILSCYLT